MHYSNWGRKPPSLLTCPFPASSPSSMCWAWCRIVWNIPVISGISAVPAISHHNILCSPSLLAGVRGRTGLDAVQALLINYKNILELSTVFSTNQKYNLIPATQKKITSAKISTLRPHLFAKELAEVLWEGRVERKHPSSYCYDAKENVSYPTAFTLLI